VPRKTIDFSRVEGFALIEDPQWYLDRLTDAEEAGEDEWRAWCPCHDDYGTSEKGLSLSRKGKKLLAKCHSPQCGVTLPDVQRALEGRDSVSIAERNGQVSARATPAPRGTYVTHYTYTDEERRVLYEVIRYENPKDFRPRRPDKESGTWVKSLKNPDGSLAVRPVPYHLPDLITALREGHPVCVTDGEKDADRSIREGKRRRVVGTTFAKSAGGWHSEFAELFRGASNVTLALDLDSGAGLVQVREIARDLDRVDCDYRVVKPKEGKDLSDHFDHGHSWDDFIEVELDGIAPPRFEFQNLAEIMREGFRPPEMLISEWIVIGQVVWVQGEPGDGKTWIALYLAARALNDGKRVLFADEEMGGQETAQRLIALGVSPEVVEERFDYLPFPGIAKTDAREWQALCEERAWGLAVFDSGADFFASAEVNEDVGVEVTWWIKTFFDPIRLHGGTPLMVESCACAEDAHLQRRTASRNRLSRSGREAHE
jgi:hypothetical protein